MSTEDTTKLIEEARNHVEHFSITGGDALRVTRLADALESQVTENEKLREAARLSRSIADEYSAERDALRAQLDDMTTEVRTHVGPGHDFPVAQKRHVGPWVEVSE